MFASLLDEHKGGRFTLVPVGCEYVTKQMYLPDSAVLVTRFLSEAGIDYDRLLTDVDDANSVLSRADVAMVIGANDIVNPAALDDKSSPIYGMPVLTPWESRTTMVVKRGMASGFAGIDNPLFYRDNTVMLFGDAKRVATDLVSEIKGMEDSH